MEAQNPGKILVALDGSPSALQVVRYLGGLTPLKNRGVVLFSVFEGVPDYYREITRSLSFHSSPAASNAWEAGQKVIIEEELENARRILIENDFAEGNITIKLRKKHKGTAQDILEEAMGGYSLVAAGRKGKNRVEELIFGSVTAKLISRLTHASILMVGKKEVPNSGLVLLDCLEGSGRIADFALEYLPGSAVEEITLMHVIKGGGRFTDTGGGEEYFLREVKARVTDYLGEIKARFEGAGFPGGKINIEVIEGAESRAGSIISHARREGYGTLVLGRKSEADRSEFSMGEVSGKVVQMSKGAAVFIVR